MLHTYNLMATPHPLLSTHECLPIITHEGAKKTKQNKNHMHFMYHPVFTPD